MDDRRVPFRRLLNDTRGATAIEYALIAGGVSIFILGAVNTLGANLVTVFYDKLTTMF